MSFSPTDTPILPHDPLTKIIGKPTYLSIKLLKEQLYANAFAIPTSLGGGAHGHIVLVLGETAFNALAGTVNWANPAHPATPTWVDDAATDAQLRFTYNNDLVTFQTFQKAKSILKKQLLQAVDDTYLCALKVDVTGYSNVSLFDLLSHLSDNYATVDADVLTQNLHDLDIPWEPSVSMDPLWNKFTEAQAVATAGGEQITEATVIRKLRDLIDKSRLFDLDIREWDALDAADRTLDAFKTRFTAANNRRVKKQTANQTLGFAGAAQATTPVGGTPTSGTPTSGTPTSHSATPTTLVCFAGTNFSYCWSHGLTNNTAHNSMTCTKKAQGHQSDATIMDMKGGNNTIRRKRGEKNTYRQLNNTPQRTSNANDAAAAGANNAETNQA